MDWLTTNHASIHFKEGTVTFTDKYENEVLIQGKNGKPKVRLVKARNFLRGARKGLQIYVVNLNKVEDPKPNRDPEILSEFRDMFLEKLTKLPLTREVGHEIEAIPRISPVSKRPYKMSLLEAIELKEQLRKLLEQGFVKPSNSPWGVLVLFQKKKDGSLCL